MSLGENSLVAAYQGRGQLKSRPSGTRVVTPGTDSHSVLIREGPCSSSALRHKWSLYPQSLNPWKLASFQMGLCLFTSAYPTQRRNIIGYIQRAMLGIVEDQWSRGKRRKVS